MKVGEASPSIESNRYVFKSDVKPRENVFPHLSLVPALTLLNETLERMVDTCGAITDAFEAQQNEKMEYILSLNNFECKNQDIMDEADATGALPTAKEEQKLERLKETMRLAGDKYNIATTRLLEDYKIVREMESIELFRGIFFMAQHEADATWCKLQAWEDILVQIQLLETDWNESLSSIFPSTVFSTASSYQGSFRTVDGDDDEPSVSRVTHIMI